MKKYFVLSILCVLPKVLIAGEWNYDAKGLFGAYYGVSDTNGKNKYPDRWVLRGDVNFKTEYSFNEGHKVGLYASTTMMLREDDKNRSEGEYRFYPYVADISKYGEFYLGYTYNAANMLYKGAKDITFLKIDDSNATYFLSNPNWDNGYKDTLFATPKSTTILNDGRAAKFTYILPVRDEIKVGFSYTPDNADRRGMNSRYVDYEKKEDGYTGAIQKKWNIGKIKIYNSIGYGIFNRTDKELSLGTVIEYDGLNIGVGYKKAYVDGVKNPVSMSRINENLPAYFDNYRESKALNFSVGYKRNDFQTNLAYLNTSAQNTRHQDNLLIWSNVYSVNDNIEVYLMGAYLNIHSLKMQDDGSGYAAISGIGFRF